MYFNCVNRPLERHVAGFLFTLNLDGHTIVFYHVSEQLNFIMVLE
jgi:hypothetical protein